MMRAISMAGFVVASALWCANGATAAVGDPSLIEAVQRGDSAAIQRLMQRRVDVNQPAVDGTTALHWAVHRNDVDTVDALLRAGANVNAMDRYGIAPLALAAEQGNAPTIKRLLVAGGNPNSAWPGGETALMTAARSGHAPVVQLLLEAGADVNHRETTRGQTALMWAAAEGHVDVIRLLVARGAEISARATGPKLAPSFDVKKQAGFESILLKDTGAKRLDTLTPLLFAVRRGNIAAAGTLVELGAPVEETAPDGRTALMLAITNAHYELAAMLLAKGANPKSSIDGWTPLHQLVATSNPPMHLAPGALPTGTMSALTLAEQLIAKHAEVNAVVKKPLDDAASGRAIPGATPLFLAATRFDAGMIRLLLANGADQRIAIANGTTPLMSAAGLFDDNQPEDSIADAAARLVAVKVLVDAGGEVNVVNKTKNTALHGSVRRGAKEVGEFLIAHGARLDAKTDVGLTPLAIAEGKECYRICAEGIPGAVRPQMAKMLHEAMVARGVPIDESIKPAYPGMRRTAPDPDKDKAGVDPDKESADEEKDK